MKLLQRVGHVGGDGVPQAVDLVAALLHVGVLEPA